MRRFFLLLVLASVLAGIAWSQDPAPVREPRLLDYHTMTDWLPETPGVTSGAVGGFINPATWSTLQMGRPEFAFWWNDRSVRRNSLDNWGFSTSGWLGFGANSQVYALGGETYRVTDWQLGLSGGDRRSRLGLAYRWATGDDRELGREDALVVGLLSRPHRLLSVGMSGTWSMQSRARQGVFDLGLRPLGDDKVTLYADYTLATTDRWDDGLWGAGVTVRPVPGLHLGVTARDAPGSSKVDWVANVGVTLEDLGFHWLPRWNTDGDLARSSFLVRSNPPVRNLTNELRLPTEKQKLRLASLNLENKYLTYQRYQYFDERRVAWLELSHFLDAVAQDDQLGGLLINLSDFQARPSLVWEFRQRLLDLQTQGKQVIVLANRLDMVGYYIASVADHLMLDPEGVIVLQGIASGRTYLKDMLEKIGIGFQELRYFKYKSAAEVGARMDMSEGEREQRQRMVDVIYEELRAGTCAARHLTHDQYDALVDDELALLPDEAEAAGLIDAVGRQADLMQWLHSERRATLAGPHYAYLPGAYPEEHWGEPERIAVVYAVGGCMMDEGIKGRATGRFLNGLVNDPSVAAVVLRADSPGGDPLPSDLVAGAVRRLRAAGKPVIVSQGDVAASGGYWISMDGDEILTTPLTVTGSIGVIGAWIYVDGLDEKLGLHYDGLRRGDHADLLRNLTVPGLGFQLPQRALDEKELDMARTFILKAYDGFVSQVAESRDLPEDRVRELGQGRVWMGEDAIERGLCDQVGGLGEAIALAREKAGLGPDREVTLLEYPPRPLIDWSALFGSRGGLLGFPFGLTQPAERVLERFAAAAPWAGVPEDALVGPDPGRFDYALWFLESLGQQNGKPRMVLPPDSLPAGWDLPD